MNIHWASKVYRVWSKEGKDYGWHRLSYKQAETMRKLGGCGLEVSSKEVLREGQDWCPGRNRRARE